MVRRAAHGSDDEPEQKQFVLPSEKEHLFQVVDVFTDMDDIGQQLNLDEVTVVAKCEVVGGDEEGRTLLNRLCLDSEWRGFFATRFFLKAIGEPYKGQFDIDTSHWPGRQFFATVVHNKSKDGTKTYANISEYNFEKKVEQFDAAPAVKSSDEVKWD